MEDSNRVNGIQDATDLLPEIEGPPRADSVMSAEHSGPADAAHTAIQTCDAVFGVITVSLALYASYLGWQEQISALMVALLWSVPVLNLLWSTISSRLGPLKSEVIRCLACLPITTILYMIGDSTLERFWIPSQVMVVGSTLILGVHTCSMRPGVICTSAFALALPISMGLVGDAAPALTATHAIGLLVTGLVVAIVSALLGRTIQAVRKERDEAQRQHCRAENALAELAAAQAQLMDTARSAGMAELASGVLHNVGNVLTSVNVAASSVRQSIAELPRLHRVIALLGEQSDMDGFWSSAKGKLFPEYLVKLSANIDRSIDGSFEELNALQSNIDHIKSIVAAQQEYARPTHQIETFTVEQLVQQALQLERSSLSRGDIELQIHVEAGLPTLETDRHKILQILINLIRNSCQAVMEGKGESRLVELYAGAQQGMLRIEVRDSGPGIDAETIPKLFRHGFTTRVGGHGFGLHMSALAAKQLGGSIRAESDGLGCGANFIVEIPVRVTQNSR